MGKKIMIVSGLLAVLAFFGGLFLEGVHSPLKDFTQYLLLPVFAVVFLVSLFVVPLRPLGARTRIIFRGLRWASVLGLLAFLAAVFLPRSYGTLPMVARAKIHYWPLPTGSRIGYTLIPGTGPKKPFPIIYLQGGPGGSMSEGLIRILTPFASEGYDVYVYDQIGSGWSGRLADIREYTTDRHKRDLEAIVQQIGAEKVILIGQSWGAILATLYVADNPGRVAKLILTGPGPIQPTNWALAGLKAPDSLHLREPYYTNHQGNELAHNLRTRAMEIFASSFGWKLASDAEADDFAAYQGSLVNRSTVCDTSLIPHTTPQGGAGFYVQVMTVHSFGGTRDPRSRLSGLPVPLLVLKGQCDNQKWGFTNEYLQLFPFHRLVVIPDAGHGIYGEQPERYLSAIREFLLAAE
jgi:proline iminopeptidase